MFADPIQGNVAEFEQATGTAHDLLVGSRQLVQLIHDFQSGASRAQFAGEAAEAFTKKVSEVSTRIDALPRVALRLHTVMRDHTDQLRTYRQDADDALARGRANWNRHSEAETAARAHSWRARTLEAHVDQLERTADCEGAAAAQLNETRRQLNWERDREFDARSEATNALRAYQSEENIAAGLGRKERALNAATEEALRNFEFGNLHVSGWDRVEDAARTFAELRKEFLRHLLWAVKELLDEFGAALSFACLFIPGIGPILAKVIVVTKVATDFILWRTGWESPYSPGKVVGGDEVIRSLAYAAVLMLTAGLGKAAAMKADKIKSVETTISFGIDIGERLSTGRGIGVGTLQGIGSGVGDFARDTVGTLGSRLNGAFGSRLEPMVQTVTESWNGGVSRGQCRLAPMPAMSGGGGR